MNMDHQQQSSSIMNNNNHHKMDDEHINDINNNQHNNMTLVLATQLFEAFCSSSLQHINEMSSILLSFLSPSESILSSTTTKTTSSLSTTTTSTPTPNIPINISAIISSFIELRSKYIGSLNNNNITKDNDNTNNTNNNIVSTTHMVFNYDLFHAALLTNQPTIIDAIMPYINYDFTTLNIPIDQIDCIKKNNTIRNEGDEIYPTNSILHAIVEATKKGHYQSIQHLINNYQLLPTIPICDPLFYKSYKFTTLLYHSVENNNLQLTEYLFPLCVKLTPQNAKKTTTFIKYT